MEKVEKGLVQIEQGFIFAYEEVKEIIKQW